MKEVRSGNVYIFFRILDSNRPLARFALKSPLENLREISLQNTPNLLRFPNRTLLPQVRTLTLTYPYHCCSFVNIVTDDVMDVTSALANASDVLESSHNDIVSCSPTPGLPLKNLLP